MTDSGGVQEEACILRVPCVTLRKNTQRPETVAVGANILVGVASERIMNGAMRMLETDTRWKNPFGDGHTGDGIAEIVGNQRIPSRVEARSLADYDSIFEDKPQSS